jgi:aspartate kinase
MKTPGTVVMKFGGTSVASGERRERAVARVRERLDEGLRVVVVVSAMGRKGDPYATDTLLGLLSDLGRCAARERDAILSCGEEISAALFAALLTERGLRAVSLRGFQAGIVTDDRHQDASIQEIRPARIVTHLRRGEVVVVAGFQGVTPEGDVTTIGRGGSDTTAVALGVALDADRVEIYTDVDGVLSADPRVVPEAQRVPQVSFDEAAEMAYKGARVLHPVAADLARQHGLGVRVRDAREASEGSHILPAGERRLLGDEIGATAVAVTARRGIAQFTVTGRDFTEELACLERVFGVIAEQGVSLDMMSILADRVVFTTERQRVGEVARLLSELGVDFAVDNGSAKVTLVGGGIHGVPGIMHRIVRALTRAGIAIRQSVDSNMIIGVLVDDARVDDAVRALHEEFFPGED